MNGGREGIIERTLGLVGGGGGQFANSSLYIFTPRLSNQ